jgi:hypothetical protein
MRVELPEAHLKMQAELAVEAHLVMQAQLTVQAPFVAEPQGRACQAARSAG